jgi:hypothetical protein
MHIGIGQLVDLGFQFRGDLLPRLLAAFSSSAFVRANSIASPYSMPDAATAISTAASIFKAAMRSRILSASLANSSAFALPPPPPP